jgi:hypothetical protein
MLQYRTKEIIEVKLTDELFEDGFLIRIIPEGTNYYLYLFHEDFAAALDIVGTDMDMEDAEIDPAEIPEILISAICDFKEVINEAINEYKEIYFEAFEEN